MTEESIFAAAVGKPAAERAAFLDKVCSGNGPLRHRVELLLEAHDADDRFLEPPAAPTETYKDKPTRPLTEGPGTRIGPYKLLQQIGEGGFGVVYMAEQEKPIRRRVALKVIKPGMDTAQVVARFEAERQALAMMEHPNVARVIDGGTTDAGRSFFVMELVKGVAVTKYCDDNHLTPKERLELFIPVCQAIQHAHQKGIIHRDIKPSNVLVTLYDGMPVPKVIDFGIAKATDQRLTERTMFTQFGAVIGTFEYMSPEQAEMSGLDIDTRSDIYSLGVLLYEMLTGTTPLEKAKLQKAAYAEILRRIREEEPPKPSTRLSASKEALASIAAQRRTEPAALARLVRGELDWIVMKALEKDRARRYQTANGLARDVERYLHDEPVEACPPSATYRVRKLARKYRGLLTAVAAFAALLVLGAAVSTYQAIRATAARNRAEQAERLASERLMAVQTANARTQRALADADEARRQAELVSRRLVDFFRRPDPSQDGRQLKVVDLLDQAALELEAESDGVPKIKGDLLLALGETYMGLGLAGRAVELLEKARAVRQAALGPEHTDTLTSMEKLAVGYWLAGRAADAITLHETALKLRKAKLGPDHPDTLSSMFYLALAYQWGGGRLAEAIPLHEETLKLRSARLGPDHPDTLDSRYNLALAYQYSGRLEEATPLLEEVLKLRRAKLGPDHQNTLESMQGLATNYQDAGRLAEAIPLYEAVVKLREAKLGPDHPDTLNSMSSLAWAYRNAGRLAEAILLSEAALKLRRAKLGPDHPDTLMNMNGLASAYLDAGRLAEAESLQREALALQRKKLGEEDPEVAGTLSQLGMTLLQQKRYAEAEPLLRVALSIRERKQPDAWWRFHSQSLLGGSLLGQKRYAEAEPLLVSGYEGMKQREAKIPAPFKPALAEAGKQVVQLYVDWSKPDQAAAWRAKLRLPAETDRPKP